MSLPLAGKKIVVTRAREQSGDLQTRLIELGADVIEFPVIQIVEPLDFEPLDRAIDRLADYDWLIFTSVNGVDFFWRRLLVAGKTAHDLAGRKLCAIGPATAAALEGHGLKLDLVPGRFVAEGILEEMGEVSGQKFLLPRADIAREALIEGLEARGASVEQVTAYRTIVAPDRLESGEISATELVHLLESGQIDLVSFTSSSTVRNFAARLATATPAPLPQLLSGSQVACIGPITAGTARDSGLVVNLEAPEFTIDGLVEVILDHYSPSSLAPSR